VPATAALLTVSCNLKFRFGNRQGVHRLAEGGADFGVNGYVGLAVGMDGPVTVGAVLSAPAAVTQAHA